MRGNMDKLYTGLVLIIAVLFLLVLNSCTDPVTPSPYYIDTPPVITGIVVTGESSPEPLGVWGVPNEKGTLKLEDGCCNVQYVVNYYRLDSPYPNPTSDLFRINYALPVRTTVSVLLVKGKLQDGIIDPTIYANGNYYAASQNFSTVIYEGVKEAGIYQLNIELNDSPGPLEFYRVYLIVNGNALWRNVAQYDLAGTEEGSFFR